MTEQSRMEQSRAMDFEFLRREGTRLLQKMSGEEWSDYNLHDPGVTILEYLCFAITDLAYRTNFDIADLLTQKDGTIDYQGNSFIKPAEVLSSNAVTIKDFRKILLDEIPEIFNVWIHSVNSRFSSDSIKGLYKFYVQVGRDYVPLLTDGKDPAWEMELKKNVQRLFVSNRNLCEDASNQVYILQPENVVVNARVVINQDTQPENIMALIYYKIEKFLNPGVRYYTEKELLNRDYTFDEIYSGPLLKGGFIPDEDLKPRNLWIDPAELARVISTIQEVVVVQNLTVNGSVGPISIDPLTFPYFNIEKSRKGFHVFSDEFELSVKQSLLDDMLHNLRERSDKRYIHSFNEIVAKDLQGTYKGGEYHSVQHVFPAIYGIGEQGLSGSENALHLAYSKQLKGYLMFFEQIMADYLAQVNGLNELFSNKLSSAAPKTYYTQALNNVPRFSEMVYDHPGKNKGSWREYFDDLSADSYSDFLKRGAESREVYFDRKNKMLDHLLARFNEVVTTYPVQLFDKLYGKNQKELSAENELKWKSGILLDINKLSHSRSLGFNYLRAEKKTSGYDFIERMYHLLYIKNKPGKSLVQVFTNELKVERSMDNVSESTQEKKYSRAEAAVESGIRKIRILTKKKLQEIREKKNLKEYPADQGQGSAVFGHQPVSFLKHALNIDNYRLANDQQDHDSYLLLYHEPEGHSWLTVNRYDSYSQAIKGLDTIIDLLIKTSIDSEGFYLIEHVLLRPLITSENFGFRFYSESNQMILESRFWTTFEQREQKITDLIRLVRKSSMLVPEKLKESLSNEYNMPARMDGADMKDLMSGIKMYIQGQKKGQCRFEMIVKRDGKIILEDDFNFRMSVLLPEWPARFQDKVFQEFITELFRVRTPAHIRLKFYWLNIHQMTVFEEMNINWLRELKLNKENEERIACSNLSYFLETLD